MSTTQIITHETMESFADAHAATASPDQIGVSYLRAGGDDLTFEHEGVQHIFHGPAGKGNQTHAAYDRLRDLRHYGALATELHAAGAGESVRQLMDHAINCHREGADEATFDALYKVRTIVDRDKVGSDDLRRRLSNTVAFFWD